MMKLIADHRSKTPDAEEPGTRNVPSLPMSTRDVR